VRGRDGGVRTDRRGVSEAISFVLVFSLVVSTVGIVYTVGYADLKGARDAEQVNNVQRAFDLLAENVDELVARSAPSRGTEIRLQGGTLTSGAPVSINVSGEATGDPNDNFSTGDVPSAPVTYRADDTTIRYAHGAVVRSEPSGGVFVREPSFVLDDDRIVIPLVRTLPAEGSVGGESTVLVRTENANSDVVVAETEPQDVNVTVTSTRTSVWESYLSERGLSCFDSGTDQISCTASGVDSVYVVTVTVEVNFE
jgi:hypothetical protein